jgi:hypothetical protein
VPLICTLQWLSAVAASIARFTSPSTVNSRRSEMLSLRELLGPQIHKGVALIGIGFALAATFAAPSWARTKPLIGLASDTTNTTTNAFNDQSWLISNRLQVREPVNMG